VAERFSAGLDRLARAYEADAEARRDLLQEVHLQLWRSLAQFDGRCSLRRWVYRVAHNVAAAHVIRQRRLRSRLVTIESLETAAAPGGVDLDAARAEALERLSALIRRLRPLDRQIIVLYLEDFDAASIAEITGLSAANVAMKIHRIKKVLRGYAD
jgi:RNA polymerase sigma-70 factor (ECF subfamily)